MPPPLSESTARRVHKITDWSVGSPEATPRVNGSLVRSVGGTGEVVGAADVEGTDESGDGSVEGSFLEQATTTTEALKAKNMRREIGEVIGRVLHISSRV